MNTIKCNHCNTVIAIDTTEHFCTSCADSTSKSKDCDCVEPCDCAEEKEHTHESH